MIDMTGALTLADGNALAMAVQDGVPLCTHPFDELGRRLELRSSDVLQQLRTWSSEGKLREISAVLEGNLLGYDSALCAAAVPEQDLPRVIAVVNAHPTVTHNYLRGHAYNLWFTIAVPQAMGLDQTLARLERRAGVRVFPARRRRTFKVGVNFDLLTGENSTSAQAPPETAPVDLSARDERLFRTLQTPLPLIERPFAALAGEGACTEGELLTFARRHLGGAIRRYVATFRQQRLGVRGSAMVVWNVPDEKLEETGRRLADAPQVSHCYAREPLPDFPYTLYSMVHGPDEARCRDLVGRLAALVGIDDYALLVTTRELKKCRLRYFLPELERWWDDSSSVALILPRSNYDVGHSWAPCSRRSTCTSSS
ncbi:MAG: hypothetical protein HY655_06950 [Acidobacteria bacterium]|nr:hypothetical protein [Acidobacteriota bacterium]